MPTRPAGRTDAFNDIFGFLGLVAFGQEDRGYVYVGETERAVALAAGEVDVTAAMTGVVEGTDAVLLRAAAVVDLMEQMSLGQRGERAEECGAIDRRQRGLKIGQREGIAEAATNLTPDKQAYRRDANACIVE